jgi:hypothetical protein
MQSEPIEDFICGFRRIDEAYWTGGSQFSSMTQEEADGILANGRGSRSTNRETITLFDYFEIE